MTERRKFTDEELTAYLDGEVDAISKRAIATALVLDPPLQERLDALQVSVGAVKEAFDGLLAAAPDLPALPMQATSSAPGRLPSRPMALAMTACLVLGVGLGTGFMSWRANTVDWKDSVAIYQSLYVKGTLEPVALTLDEIDLNLASLGAVLEYDISPAQTDSILEYKRGQLLGFQGRPLIQLTYITPQGEPVALCIIRTDNTDLTAVRSANLEGMAAAYWEKDGLAYLLIGGTDTALIKDAADRMVDRL